MDGEPWLPRHDDDEMLLTHANSSDAELIAELVAASLIVLAPFLAFGLVAGYVTGRFIRDPLAAAWASGFVGLMSFWLTLVAAVVAYVPGGSGAAVGAVLTIFLYVAFFASPVFGVLAYLMYRNRRLRLAPKSDSA